MIKFKHAILNATNSLKYRLVIDTTHSMLPNTTGTTAITHMALSTTTSSNKVIYKTTHFFASCQISLTFQSTV